MSDEDTRPYRPFQNVTLSQADIWRLKALAVTAANAGKDCVDAEDWFLWSDVLMAINKEAVTIFEKYVEAPSED